MPGVRVAEVHDELMGIPGIAARCGVTHDLVQAWTAMRPRAYRRPFPAPRQAVDGGLGASLIRLYAWRELVGWLREVIRIDPEEGIDYLDDEQHAALNAELAVDPSQPGWHPINVEMEGTITDVEHVLGTEPDRASAGALAGRRGPQLRFSFG
jgi:hypothetical protein